MARHEKIRWLILIVMYAVIAAPAWSQAAPAGIIKAEADTALRSFVHQIPGANELGKKAAGVLVFPSVIKVGIGLGGEYGEGLLLVNGRIAGYYNLISASFGFQLGAQERSVIVMFMTNDALSGFNRKAGWRVGVDGSVAIVTVGVGGSIDTERLQVRSSVSFLIPRD